MVCDVGNRGMYDISADILRVARNGAKKTHIVYRANLNFAVVKRYLGRLERGDLITRVDEVFRTTERGIEFLDHFKALKGYLEPQDFVQEV